MQFLGRFLARSLPSLAAVAALALPAFAQSSDEPLLPQVESQQRLAAQMIRSDVEQELRDARTRIANDPSGVYQNLSLLAARVAKARGLTSRERTTLHGQVARVQREARRRALEQQATGTQRAQSQAEQEAARQGLELTGHQQERVKQMVDRFHGLLEQGRYDEAKQIGQSDLRLVGPGATAGVSAPLVADAIDKGTRARELSKQRTEGLADFYASEERSAVPFDDSRPFRYPDTESWKRLTESRRERFSVSNKQYSPQEKKIFKALEEPTELDFDNTQLSDVVSYLKDLHGIEIQLDNSALEWVGITSATPITRHAKGIRLKSALKLVLRELDLSYMVADDVLLITTPERAAQAVDRRVYPVEDLVMPKANPFGVGFGGFF